MDSTPSNNSRRKSKPLGITLQQADLISQAQIDVALIDQAIHDNLRIGEILALRGWIKPETADFFAEQWPAILRQHHKQPLGHYLKEAALLSDQQIKSILQEQQRIFELKQKKVWVRFGKIVVLKGWLKETTLDFFLESLQAKSTLETVYIGQKGAGKRP